MNEESKIRAEQVESVETPPRVRVEPVRVEDVFEVDVREDDAAQPRKRDYLDGFLAHQPATATPAEPGGATYEAVIDALKDIFDPEIPVNIYDLGLIYGVEVSEDSHVIITMTLTTPHCPVAESMPGEIEMRVGSVPGVGHVDVNLVWDPPWDPQKMSDEAKLELGML